LQNLNEGGIAYLSRKHDNASFDSSDVDEDEDDDDNDDDNEGILARIQELVQDQQKCTFWNVEVDSQASSEDFGVLGKTICDRLLAVYKSKIKWQVSYDNVDIDTVDALPNANKIEEIQNIYSPFEMSWITEIPEPDQKYKFDNTILQPIINPEFVCDDEGVFNAVQNKEDVQVIKKWGDKYIKFTMKFSDRTKMLVNNMKETVGWFGRLKFW
jgi:hypothetical protein